MQLIFSAMQMSLSSSDNEDLQEFYKELRLSLMEALVSMVHG